MGLLREAAKQKPDKVPAGWKTTAQWAEDEGMAQSSATNAIRNLVRSGKWESRKFRIDVGTKIYPTPHYRPKS